MGKLAQPQFWLTKQHVLLMNRYYFAYESVVLGLRIHYAALDLAYESMFQAQLYEVAYESNELNSQPCVAFLRSFSAAL